MTSKELAKEIRSIITYLCEVSGKQDKYALECCDVIEKDLEILEILKSKIGINYIPTQVGIEQEKYILTGAEITKEEYELLREWLENE